MSTIKIGGIELERLPSTTTASAIIRDETQEQFEESLRALLDALDWLRFAGVTEIVFQAGESLHLPDWFISALTQAGINVKIRGDSRHLDVGSTLQDRVDLFCNHIAWPKILEVSGPYLPYQDTDGEGRFPCSDDPGCYFFLSSAGEILYVGSCTTQLGYRIWSHLGRRRKPGENGALYPDAKDWVKANQPGVEIWAVAVPRRQRWMAMALEGFLIEELQPPNNRNLRKPPVQQQYFP